MRTDLDQFNETASTEAFALQNSKLLKVHLDQVTIQAKLGSMVAYQGDVTLRARRLGRHRPAAQEGGHRRGPVADEDHRPGRGLPRRPAQDIHLIYLENDKITVNGPNLLAFDAGIDWDIERVQGASGMMGGGLFNTRAAGHRLGGDPVRRPARAAQRRARRRRSPTRRRRSRGRRASRPRSRPTSSSRTSSAAARASRSRWRFSGAGLGARAAVRGADHGDGSAVERRRDWATCSTADRGRPTSVGKVLGYGRRPARSADRRDRLRQVDAAARPRPLRGALALLRARALAARASARARCRCACARSRRRASSSATPIAEVPPRVEYALTEKGLALLPIIDGMREYGTRWLGAEACEDDATTARSPARARAALVRARRGLDAQSAAERRNPRAARGFLRDASTEACRC